MNQKTIASIATYTISTFVLAVLWHIVLFKDEYEVFNYIESEPNFILGFSTILLQAIILSFFYAHLRKKIHLSAMKYVSIMGAFFWTSHVLAFIAKQDVGNFVLFFSMETIYLILQFGLYGIALRWLYR